MVAVARKIKPSINQEKKRKDREKNRKRIENE